jgi:hypothetical protein
VDFWCRSGGVFYVLLVGAEVSEVSGGEDGRLERAGEEGLGEGLTN